ncbi:hypothetical protein PHMEG_0007112 [Phytophthora megakarya]|uniref:Uncharacterized protein n=1 Tax=Phytophthora megakarya TaxID=4795 RepID=A0A225WM57_9STRA|nr:hypothetical protein PHMEG_0007112 [Phytophthora megakarya]
MRERLDIVLAQSETPSLNADVWDEPILEDIVHTDEQMIHESYGVDGYASGSQTTAIAAQASTYFSIREPRIAKGKIIEELLWRGRNIHAPVSANEKKEAPPVFSEAEAAEGKTASSSGTR